jgi:RHS repeat-associated protein
VRGSARARALLIAAVALVLLSVAAAAVARNSERRAPAPAPAGLADDPRIELEMARAEERANRRRAKLASPAARAARKRSRDTFVDLSAAAALRIAEDEAGGALKVPAPEAPDLKPGERIVDYLDESTFQVATPNGDRLLVEGTEPVITGSADRDPRPIDLSLERAADGAVGPATSTAPVEFGRTAGDAIEFPDIRLRIGPDGEDDASRTVAHGKAFYGNVAQDTDFFVSPTVRGVETFWQIRSPGAPEEAALDFAKHDADTTVTVERDRLEDTLAVTGARVEARGRIVAHIAPPMAWDADNEPVPVTYASSGSRLRVLIDHRDRDIRYPVTVDPAVYVREDHSWLGSGDPYTAGGRWGYYTPSANRLWFTTSYDAGLSITSGNNLNYWDGDYGDWNLPAWPDTRIWRVEVGDLRHSPQGTCVDLYIYGGGVQASHGSICGPPPNRDYGNTICAKTRAEDPNPGCAGYGGGVATDSNLFLFRLRFHGTYARGPVASASLHHAWVYYWEPYAPRVDSYSTDPPTRWLDTYERTVSVTAKDTGLGIRRITLTRPDGTTAQAEPSTLCATTGNFPGASTSNNRNACRTLSWTSPAWAYTTEGAPEGTTQLKATTEDWAGNPSPAFAKPIRIDRSPPAPTQTAGPLSKDSVAGRNGWAAAHMRTLDTTATDTYSGVKNIELLIDGQRKELFPADGANGSCNQEGCPGTRTHPFNWDTSTAVEGRPYELKVVARDPLDPDFGRHSHTTAPWSVKVDKTLPSVPDSGLRGSLSPSRSHIGKGRQTLHVDATDGPSGVRRFEMTVTQGGQTLGSDAQNVSCSADCPQSASTNPALSWDSTNVSGTVQVTLKVFDLAGNVRERAWPMTVDTNKPTVTTSGGLSKLIATGSDLRVVADDAGTGIGEIAIWVDPDADPSSAEAAFRRTYPCASRCSAQEVVDYTLPSTVAEGRHTILVKAYDETRQEGEKRWDAIVDRSNPAFIDAPTGLSFWNGNSAKPRLRAKDFGGTSAGANLLRQSSFEGSLGSAAATGATLTREQPAGGGAHGSWAAKLTSSAAGDTVIRDDANRVAVTPGDVLTISASVRTAAAGRTFKLFPRWLNSSGGLLSTPHPTSFTGNGTGFTRAHATVNAPANAAYLAWGVVIENVPVGNVNWVDAVQIERGAHLSDYSPLPAEVPASQRSGVTRMELWSRPVGTGSGVQYAASSWPCPDGSCHQTWSPAPSPALPEGRQELWGKAHDQIGNAAESGHWEAIVDRSAPSVTTSGPLKDAQGTSLYEGTYAFTASSTDGAGTPASAQRSGVTSTRFYLDANTSDADPGQELDPGAATQTCSGGSCSMTRTLTFKPRDWAAGDYVLRVRVADQLGNQAAEQTVPVRVRRDETDPRLTLSGSLTTPVATGRNLHMVGEDDETGIQRFTIWVDPDADPTENEAAEPPKTYACPCRSSEQHDFVLPAGTQEGKHTILVRATDGSGRFTDKRFDVQVVDLLQPKSRSKLGLEHWFQYDDTPAGAGTNVFVNAETGNAVWHSVPIVNAGRGLSTVVNLTYNSQDRGGILGSQFGHIPAVDLSGQGFSNDLPGVSYSDAGVGFSIAVSGPTRLNEPLGGVLLAQALEDGESFLPDLGGLQPGDGLKITLTDADGTVHTFTRSGPDAKWVSPPGLNMHLRRWNPDGDLVNPVDDQWAMTRADGVTHFFDTFGYLTRTEDRNGNALRYEYETYDALTGRVSKDVPGSPAVALCGDETELGKVVRLATGPLTGTDVLCGRRVARVLDPEGRALEITYRQDPLVGDYPTLDRRLWYESAQVLAGHSRIDNIVDHKSRRYQFEYEDGFLTRFTEVADADEETRRVTDFRYEAWDTDQVNRIAQDRQLTEVVENRRPFGTDQQDPADKGTVIRYVDAEDRKGVASLAPGVFTEPREVCGVTKRNDGETTSIPAPVEGQECRSQRSDLETTYRYERPDGRTTKFHATNVLERSADSSTTTTTELDAEGRPTLMTESLAEPGEEANGPKRSTALTWNNAVNAVASVEKAAGSVDAVLTELSYDQRTGALVQQTQSGQGDPARTTTFCYQYSSGVHHSPARGEAQLPPPAASCTTDDHGDASWVADLSEIQKPEANTGASFEIQKTGGKFTGNVVRAWTRPGRQGPPAITNYDAEGQITSEVDEDQDTTTYADHHATGQPGTVTDPEGAVWKYGYDAVGNLKTVDDPRGAEAYRTTLGYDAFDRLTSEKVPHDPEADDHGTHPFTETTREYDRNGNVVEETDPTGTRTDIEYTAMDQPRLVRSDGSDREGGGDDEVTDYLYDDADRLIARIDPRGNHSSPSVGDHAAQCAGTALPTGQAHMTRYCLDAAGRRLAEVRFGDVHTLVTAYGFDARDNLVGVVDPRRAPGSVATAIDAAADSSSSRLRTSYEYNAFDEREFEKEHLSDSAEPLTTEHQYDANGRREVAYPPRAFVGEADRTKEEFATRWFYDPSERLQAVKSPAGCTAYERAPDGKVEKVTSPRGTEASGDSCVARGNAFSTLYEYDRRDDVVTRTIPFADGQYGREDDEFEQWRVTYLRDTVGDPIRICDARTNADASTRCTPAPRDADAAAREAAKVRFEANGIKNEFYASGELRSTSRPSFWALDWGSGQHGPPDAGLHYRQADPGADLQVQDGGPTLGESGDVSRTAGGSGGDPELPSTHGAGNFASVERQQPGDMLPEAGATEFEYDRSGRLERIRDAASNTREIEYDAQGRVTKKKWPFDGARTIVHKYSYNPGGTLRSYTDGRNEETTYEYDGFERRTEERTPGSLRSLDDDATGQQRTRYVYDPNGNLEERITPRDDLKFEFDYDSVDRLVTEENPLHERWAYGYDANGNRTCEVSPRGAPSRAPHVAPEDVCDPNSQFATAFEYDTSDRLIESIRSADDAMKTTYGYDADGNVTEIVAPGAAPASGEAQARRKTSMDYDGRGMVWRETSATASDTQKRTGVREYDPNGNLRRVVDPIGVGADGVAKVTDAGASDEQTEAELRDATWHATVREYDRDDQLTDVWLPWSNKAEGDEQVTADPSGPTQAERDGDERRITQTFQRAAEDNPLGRITSIVAPHEATDSKAPRTTYTYFANGWVRSQSEQKVVAVEGGDPIEERLVTYDYDAEGNQTLWKTQNTGKPSGRTVHRTFYPDGTLHRRWAAKGGADGDRTVRCYSYFYNPNRSLTQVEDFPLDEGPDRPDCATPPETNPNTTVIGRDKAEREIHVNESWRGGRDTVFEYDKNGNLEVRKTDGVFHENDPEQDTYDGPGAKTTTFQFDEFDREKETLVNPAEGPDRRTTTTWWPSGDMRERTKSNGTTETRYFSPRAEITEKVRDPDEGDAKTQEYLYDENGNRTQDERGTHRFNPRSQLVHWTRGAKYAEAGDGPSKAGTTVTYARTDAGEIAKKVDSWIRDPETITTGTTVEYQYRGERLIRSVSTVGTIEGEQKSRSDYTHDDFGSVVKIETKNIGPGTEPPAPPDGTESPENCSEVPDEAEDDVTRYCFDEFERMILSRGEGVEKPTRYEYDGLDRRDTRKVEENGEPKTYEYAYIGTSRKLSRETDKDDEVKTYDYDSQGHRLDKATKSPSDTTPPEVRTYATDANGSVEGLENEDGEFGEDGEDTYLYDPYGENEKVGDPEDPDPDAGLSDEAKDNPFRYEGFYYDSGVKSYDMEAREYRPDTGRFLSQDRYASAVGDKLLQADPLTQNRYAFAGGNPVNNVEFDGHAWSYRQWRQQRRSNNGGSGSPTGAEAGTLAADVFPTLGAKAATSVAPQPTPAPSGPMPAIERAVGTFFNDYYEPAVRAMAEAKPQPVMVEDGVADIVGVAGDGINTVTGAAWSGIKSGGELIGDGAVAVWNYHSDPTRNIYQDPLGDLEKQSWLFGGPGPKLGLKAALGLLRGVRGSRSRQVVIGKMGDLQAASRKARPWERALADDLPDMGSRAANWRQNARKLQEVMDQGHPIRDASINRLTGNLRRLDPPGIREPSFLQMERMYLAEQGWRYQRSTHKWHPPQ